MYKPNPYWRIMENSSRNFIKIFIFRAVTRAVLLGTGKKIWSKIILIQMAFILSVRLNDPGPRFPGTSRPIWNFGGCIDRLNFKKFSKISFSSLNCHFWGKISKRITRVNFYAFTLYMIFQILNKNNHFRNNHFQEIAKIIYRVDLWKPWKSP